MRKYTHGGDKYGFSRQATQSTVANDNSVGKVAENHEKQKENMKVLDFSANTNPLGMPENVLKTAKASIEFSESYPDPFCRELVEKISEFESEIAGYKIPKEWIVCGNGAADLIFRSIYGTKLKKVLVLAPTFSEYEEALEEAGIEVVHHYLKKENNFNLTKNFLEEMTKGIDGIFLCNPNNPIGNLINIELLDEILKKCKENKILLFIDECFLELTGKMKEYSLVGKLKEHDNLIVFKAFTKTYAMAGLRLGYLLTSNEAIADKIFTMGQPWSVSTPAQMAGVAALDEKEFVEKSIEFIASERNCLQRNLEQLGCKVYPGEANYIFFYHKDGKKFINEMRKKAILVRDCENYKGLTEGYMRIAVKNKIENRIFMENAKEAFKWLKA